MNEDAEAAADDATWMLRALALAQCGPAIDRNPRVGCVLVANSELVAEGWHKGGGHGWPQGRRDLGTAHPDGAQQHPKNTPGTPSPFVITPTPSLLNTFHSAP